jgi:hypothetical protein
MSAKPDPATLPCSPLEETSGLKYFPRMLGKIRLQSEGSLWEDLHANLGKGSDGACVEFLHVGYDDLKARVLQGGTDEEILDWCQQQGRPLNDTDSLSGTTTRPSWAGTTISRPSWPSARPTEAWATATTSRPSLITSMSMKVGCLELLFV